VIDRINEYVDQLYAQEASKVDALEQEQAEKLLRLRGLTVAIERTEDKMRILQSRIDALVGDVGKRSIVEIDEEGMNLREKFEVHADNLARLHSEREQIVGGKSELDTKIASESAIVSASAAARDELVELRKTLVKHIDGHIDELRRHHREAAENMSDLLRERNELNREEREQRRQKEEAGYVRQLQRDNRQPTNIDVSSLVRSGRLMDQRDEQSETY